MSDFQQQQELNFSYSQGVEYIRLLFHSLNGKVNPIFPAKYLIFDLNVEPDVLGKSVGDIVIIYMHNILKLINSDLKYKYNMTNKKIKCLLAYILLHELFHLDQDFNKYISQYPKDNLKIAIENSCNNITIEFLNNIINYKWYREYFDLDIELFSYINDIYNKVQNIPFANYNKYYKLQTVDDKISYILNNLLFQNEDNFLLLIKKNKWSFVYLEYRFDGIVQNGDLIYLNNHYVNHNIILKLLDKLLLLLSTKPQQLKISHMNHINDPSISKIIIDVLNYQPLSIVSPLDLSNETPVLL